MKDSMFKFIILCLCIFSLTVQSALAGVVIPSGTSVKFLLHPPAGIATIDADGKLGSTTISLGDDLLSATQITVFPTNKAAFPSYGVKKFGTDINAAWASIPRANDTIDQSANQWVVLMPGGVYSPASNNLLIKGSTLSGSNKIYDWGYAYLAPINGQPISGPNIPAGTTITGSGFQAGGYFGTVTYTAGSNIVSNISSTANMWVGQQVYSGSNQSALPASRIISIDSPTQIHVSNNALQSSSSISMTSVGASYVTLSQNATGSASEQDFIVNVPLQVTGTTSSGSPTVTNVSYVANIMIGQTVTGAGIPAGTTVIAKTYNATNNLGTLTLSQNATAAATVALSFQIPSLFYCDMTKRKIVNIALGPVNFGRADAGNTWNNGILSGSQFWTPQPGVDHFADMHIQLDVEFNSWSMRHGWSFSGLTPHDEASSTHFAYLSKSRLMGTLRFLDSLSGNNFNQHISLGDLEIFGNQGLMTYSQQSGTTNATTTLSGLTSTAGLYPGQAITGTGIPSNTFIQSITNNTTLVMTQAATNSATNTMTFGYALPSTLSIDGSMVTNGTHFVSIYKGRMRGIVNLPGKFELAFSEHNEFTGMLNLLQYSHIQDTTFKAGMIWTATSNNFNPVGIYSSQILNSAAFNGGANALRMDGPTNYWFNSAGAVLGASTTKQILHLNQIPIQGAGQTPTCTDARYSGVVAFTSAFVECVCNGSAWVKVADGSTACTF